MIIALISQLRITNANYQYRTRESCVGQCASSKCNKNFQKFTNYVARCEYELDRIDRICKSRLKSFDDGGVKSRSTSFDERYENT